jgi:hypothetical protein
LLLLLPLLGVVNDILPSPSPSPPPSSSWTVQFIDENENENDVELSGARPAVGCRFELPFEATSTKNRLSDACWAGRRSSEQKKRSARCAPAEPSDVNLNRAFLSFQNVPSRF